jgi:hypothetical protein
MGFSRSRDRRNTFQKRKTAIERIPRRRRFLLFWVVVLAVLSCPAQTGQEAQVPAADKPSQSTTVDDLKKNDSKPFADDPAERQKQLAADKAKLLKLATELKQEMDKTNLDTLSLSIIRKANQIEKLAHSVKQEMNRNSKPGS